MIRQLVNRMAGTTTGNASPDASAAAAIVVGANALDLALHAAQVWDAFDPPTQDPRLGPTARKAFCAMGAFAGFAPDTPPAWDHLGASFVLENTRLVQIFERVLHEYACGERLGIPGVETRRWLDTTEALLQPDHAGSWVATAFARRSSEATRRNAYWRLLGMELAFGSEDNDVVPYDKAEASNTEFVPLFQALLRVLGGTGTKRSGSRELRERHLPRVLASVESLRQSLAARHPSTALAREELAAATLMGWLELALQTDTPVVRDLGAQADSAAARLQLIATRVGLPAHRQSAALFALAPDLSVLLRAVETGHLPDTCKQLLEAESPLGAAARRVIVHWGTATGASL